MAPLAAISLLAAAAAVAINPVLINVSLTGRKKRSTEEEWSPEMQEKMHELQVKIDAKKSALKIWKFYKSTNFH